MGVTQKLINEVAMCHATTK